MSTWLDLHLAGVNMWCCCRPYERCQSEGQGAPIGLAAAVTLVELHAQYAVLPTTAPM